MSCLCAGESGKAVVIDKDKLAPDERKKFDDGWQKNAYNQYASDMISLHRSLPDVRDTEWVVISEPASRAASEMNETGRKRTMSVDERDLILFTWSDSNRTPCSLLVKI